MTPGIVEWEIGPNENLGMAVERLIKKYPDDQIFSFETSGVGDTHYFTFVHGPTECVAPQ